MVKIRIEMGDSVVEETGTCGISIIGWPDAEDQLNMMVRIIASEAQAITLVAGLLSQLEEARNEEFVGRCFAAYAEITRKPYQEEGDMRKIILHGNREPDSSPNETEQALSPAEQELVRAIDAANRKFGAWLTQKPKLVD